MPQIFDVSEKAPEVEAAVEAAPERQNVQRKNVVSKAGKIGTIAHYHKMEDDVEIWDEPCLWREWTVNVPKGLDINGEIYSGKVIVPDCVAGTLGVMENHFNASEEAIFRGKSFNRVVGNL